MELTGAMAYLRTRRVQQRLIEATGRRVRASRAVCHATPPSHHSLGSWNLEMVYFTEQAYADVAQAAARRGETVHVTATCSTGAVVRGEAHVMVGPGPDELGPFALRGTGRLEVLKAADAVLRAARSAGKGKR